MSIWNGVNRLDFETSVATLQQTAPSQRPRPAASLGKLESNTAPTGSSQGHSLPLNVEKQICEDIAFLAACESAEGGVTAATLQEPDQSNATSINVAANEGISGEVQENIGGLLRLLEECAHRVIDTKQCASQILETMLQLHRGRILERLGLREFKGVKRRAQGPVSISCRLREMLGRTPVSGNRVIRAALLLDIRALREAIEHLENDTSNSTASLQNVVEVSSRIAKPNESLTLKLIKAGYSAGDARRKEIRHIKSLANYQHCCNRLAASAHKYKIILGSMNLNLIPAYPMERWKGSKHFVHAEIQLLIYHEMCSDRRLPRYIGVSKRACFLCYGFIQAYGMYVMPETHGEVFTQWTIPDRNDYSERSRIRLRQALISTRDGVSSALAASRARNYRFAPEIQSPNRSIIFALTSASSTTTAHSASRSACGSPSLHRQKSKPISNKVPGSIPSTSSDTIRESFGSDKSILRSSDLFQEHKGSETIERSQYSVFEVDWLTLFLPFDDDTNTYYPNPDVSGGSHSVKMFVCQAKRIAEQSISTSTQVVNVTDLGAGEALKLNGTTKGELDVVFVAAGKQAIGIQLARSQAT